jgi:hypothetical protein
MALRKSIILFLAITAVRTGPKIIGFRTVVVIEAEAPRK